MHTQTPEGPAQTNKTTLKGRKGIVLLSDGFDSPVAAHMMHGVGMASEYLHCPLTPKVHEKVHLLMQHLADSTGVELTLTIVPIESAQTAYARSANRRFQCIFCKRFMMRIAETIIHEKLEQGYIITGDNLGQVASQTIQNMARIDKATGQTILRPLLGFDKQQILQRARAIGTHDLSAQKSPACPFVPPNPHTMAKDDVILENESLIDIPQLLQEALSAKQTIVFSPGSEKKFHER